MAVEGRMTMPRLDVGALPDAIRKTYMDPGCGAGTDLLIAAQMTDPEGRGIAST